MMGEIYNSCRERKSPRQVNSVGGKGVRLMAAFILTLILTVLMGVCSWAAQEDKVFYLIPYDDNGEVLNITPAFIYDAEDGEGSMVFADSSYLEEEASSYYLVSQDWNTGYGLKNPRDQVGGVTLFEFEDQTPSESVIMGLAAAKKGDVVNAVYLSVKDQQVGFESTDCELTDAQDDEDNNRITYLNFALSEDINSFLYPVALINEEGNLVGIITSEGNCYTFWYKEKDFNGSYLGYLIIIAGLVLSFILVIGFLMSRKKKQTPASSQAPAVFSPLMAEEKPTTNIPYSPAPNQNLFSGPEPVPVGRYQIKVEAMDGDLAGRRYSIGRDGVTFGRDSAAGIRFAQDSKGVSRRHCRIFWDDNGTAMLMDCGSTYGTLLKGYGKLSPQKPVPIKAGDTFCLGSEKNCFRVY